LKVTSTVRPLGANLARRKPCIRQPLFGSVGHAGQLHHGHDDRCGDRGNVAGLDSLESLQTGREAGALVAFGCGRHRRVRLQLGMESGV
jgi:hypothetical protein